MLANVLSGRLAPENPYPAAVNDSWEAVLWTRTRLPNIVPINPAKLAVGGSSAGGNLAAIMTQRCASLGQSTFLSQYLIVPVTDNTATTSTSKTYKDYEFTPALPAEKMLWYRRHYLPVEANWADAEASPLLWEGDWSLLPPALIVVGELDVLRGEGEQFADQLKKAGVSADLRVSKGMPHPFLAMDGVLAAGRDAITYICETLKEAFA